MACNPSSEELGPGPCPDGLEPLCGVQDIGLLVFLRFFTLFRSVSFLVKKADNASADTTDDCRMTDTGLFDYVIGF